MIKTLRDRLLALLPHREIHDPRTSELYLVRYTLLAVLGRRVYLHHIVAADRRPHLHDHPWRFVSIVLAGGYVEQLPRCATRWRRPGAVVFAGGDNLHRVSYVPDGGAWTLVFTGKRRQAWGFRVGHGLKARWIDHRTYHAIYGAGMIDHLDWINNKVGGLGEARK